MIWQILRYENIKWGTLLRIMNCMKFKDRCRNLSILSSTVNLHFSAGRNKELEITIEENETFPFFFVIDTMLIQFRL